MKLVYLRGALKDLDKIKAYIAQDNPVAAARVAQRIQECTARLERFPYSGRPGQRGTRILSVPDLPYVVIHRVHRDTVHVVAVFHTARNWRKL